ncbi:hypothetical protein RJ55_08422 [Drechmeria coniospora]|nr:hypothetical protein RJ55_08422 [Drechmeria coniospora]
MPSLSIFEMQDWNNSYESLESVLEQARNSHQSQPSAPREPPKVPETPATIPNKAAFASGFWQGNSGHLSQEWTPSGVQMLPFSLISLPDAAVLQQLRMARGEEDHTDLPGIFAARARSTRSETFSTLSSRNSPLTPLTPPSADPRNSLPFSTPVKPAAVYQGRNSRKNAKTSVDTPRGRIQLPASLSIGPHVPNASRPRSSALWHELGLHDSRSMMSSRAIRPSGFSSRTMQGRRRHADVSFEMFSRSETELIESARKDMLFYQSRVQTEDERHKAVFLSIVALAVLLPPIGLLALFGRFDSVVSWYSHGATHSLTGEQRGILKQQLIAEGVVYLVLVIFLAVHFTRHT